MRKRLMLPLVAAASIVATGAFAPAAHAMPTMSTQCSQCHSASTAVRVGVNQTANDGVNATYNVAVSTASGKDGWGVFRGGTKVAYGTSATGQFSVPVGSTYTVYGVINGGSSGSISISPVAPAPVPVPVPDPTPVPTPTPVPDPVPVPTPTPDPVPVPVPTPTPDPTITPVPTPTPDPTITPVPTPTPDPVPAPTVRLYTVRLRVDVDGDGIAALLTDTVTGAQFVGSVSHDVALFANVPSGTYRLSIGGQDAGSTITVPTRRHGRHASNRYRTLWGWRFPSWERTHD